MEKAARGTEKGEMRKGSALVRWHAFAHWPPSVVSSLSGFLRGRLSFFRKLFNMFVLGWRPPEQIA